MSLDQVTFEKPVIGGVVEMTAVLTRLEYDPDYRGGVVYAYGNTQTDSPTRCMEGVWQFVVNGEPAPHNLAPNNGTIPSETEITEGYLSPSEGTLARVWETKWTGGVPASPGDTFEMVYRYDSDLYSGDCAPGSVETRLSATVPSGSTAPPAVTNEDLSATCNLPDGPVGYRETETVGVVVTNDADVDASVRTELDIGSFTAVDIYSIPAASSRTFEYEVEFWETGEIPVEVSATVA